MKRLPKSFAPYFWDTEFRRLSWKKHSGYIARRLISVGSTDAVAWLRRTIGDDAIRDQIIATKARGLPFERVNKWTPRDVHDRWLAEDPKSNPRLQRSPVVGALRPIFNRTTSSTR